MISYAQADEIVSGNRELSGAIYGAVEEAGTPVHDVCKAKRCAAYLYVSGWTDRQLAVVYGGKDKKRSLKSRRREAVNELQRFGYLPTGFEWFLVRWVILPFLSAFISRILIDRLWSATAHKKNDC